ncbi:MAG: DMT family transporter [Acidobacteriota bacterium]
MQRESRVGPWLVALGAGLWGTESAWRIPLAKVFDESVMVWWEHVILVACALPFILPRLGELRRVRWQTIAWLVFSGIAGSAVGTVFFTLALDHGNPTVINVVLNIQPVLSTTGAVVLFRERLAPTFGPWALLAVVSGMVLVGLAPGLPFHIDAGVGYALVCALFWGLSTVAGRGVMVEMSLPLASGLRVVVGLVTMTVVLAVYGKLDAAWLWPAAAAADPPRAAGFLALLAILSGGLPLVVYFAGLARTRASTAGYFEMMQTLVAVLVTWGFFHAALAWWQVLAGVVLIAAVAMVQRAQARVTVY